jgi:hypothetical protein
MEHMQRNNILQFASCDNIRNSETVMNYTLQPQLRRTENADLRSCLHHGDRQ